MAARPRTLPAAAAPVLVGTAYAATLGHVQAAHVRRHAARRAVHPDRHEPLQRLQRRAPRRRHRGPARPGAGHRRRPRPAQAGADRHLRRLRARGAGRRLPDRHRRAGSCCSSASPRSSPACSTPAARGRTATRASARCSCSCSSASSPSPARSSPRREELNWESFVLAVPSACWRRAILMVNNVRDLETDRRAGKQTLAVRLGRDREPASATRCSSTSRSSPRRWPGRSAAST